MMRIGDIRQQIYFREVGLKLHDVPRLHPELCINWNVRQEFRDEVLLAY